MPYYAIKAPSSAKGPGKRRSFALQEVTDKGRVTIRNEAVDAVNKQFLAGDIDFNEAFKHVRVIRENLYLERDRRAGKTVFAAENLQLLDRYWDIEYQDRDLVDPQTALWGLQRAVEAVGELSLLVATRVQLHEQLSHAFAGQPDKHRRVVTRLNQLLKFANRGFTLRKPKPTRKLVRHLTYDQFKLVLPHLTDPDIQTLAAVAFCTGLRAGEIFGLSESSLRVGHLYVDSQLDEELIRRETKTRSVRKAWVIEDGMDVVRRWLEIPATKRDELRIIRLSVVFKAACRKAYKNKPDLHCRFHDLRHSYAIYLVSRGVPLTLVAQSLGNGVGVCEVYYSGFVLTDLSMQLMSQLLK